jgi:hypothetical protein
LSYLSPSLGFDSFYFLGLAASVLFFVGYFLGVEAYFFWAGAAGSFFLIGFFFDFFSEYDSYY